MAKYWNPAGQTKDLAMYSGAVLGSNFTIDTSGGTTIGATYQLDCAYTSKQSGSLIFVYACGAVQFSRTQHAQLSIQRDGGAVAHPSTVTSRPTSEVSASGMTRVPMSLLAIDSGDGAAHTYSANVTNTDGGVLNVLANEFEIIVVELTG